MKKFKYFKWKYSNWGLGVGKALFYISAHNLIEAKYILLSLNNFNNDPHFIEGDVIEIDEFKYKDVKILK